MKPARDGFGAAERTGEAAGLAVHPLDAGRVPDFRTLHSRCGADGWCQCVAWWVPTWAGWGDRTAAENRELRDQLFARGEYDGYLLYEGRTPIGWMQVGPVGRLPKLWNSYRLDELSVTPSDLAISCATLLPEFRGRGHLHRFLDLVLATVETNARTRRIDRPLRVLAFPKVGEDLAADDVWTGTEQAFSARGFRCLREDPAHPVLSWTPDEDPIEVREGQLRAEHDGPRRHSVVVFDLGGVLVDNAGIEQFLAWTPRLSKEELWARWLSSPSVRAFECGNTSAPEFARALRAEFELEPTPREIELEIESWICGFYSGVEELLTALRPQVRLACLSNTNQLHWDRMLREIDLYALLDHRYLSFRSGLLKPDDDIFTHLTEQLSPWTEGASERILFLDDHPRNVDAARSHGIDARCTAGIDAVRAELAKAGFQVAPPPRES